MKRIKAFLKYNKKDSLVRDSAILVFATSGLSIAGFLFHFYMGRKLGPESYSILGVVFSLLYFFLVFVQVIQTTVTNFVARYKANNETIKINKLFRISFEKVLILSAVLTLIFLSFTPTISKFLNIQLKYLIIMSGLIIFSFLLAVTRGIMQGLESFKILGINMTVEGIIKLSLGIIFVYLSFGVSGAIVALIMSYAIPLFVSIYTLRNYITKKETKIENRQLYKYTIPVLLSLLIFTAFYNVDIFLIKHFFNSRISGLYIALSFLGKIIFFGTQSIALVMFPKSVSNNQKNIITKKIINKAMAIISILGGIGVLAYFLLPKLAITILYGKEYLAIAPLLGIYGLFMLVLSLCYALIFYNLSINRKGFIYIILGFVLLETLLLYQFHQTIQSIVLMLLAISITMYISLLFYTYNDKTVNNNTSV